LKLAADGKSLRKFLTALELPKKIIEETLTDCAITALKCSRKPFVIQFRTIKLIKCDFKLECRQATVVWKKNIFYQINIDSSLSPHCFNRWGVAAVSSMESIKQHNVRQSIVSINEQKTKQAYRERFKRPLST
jgi:hypothetical protein